jgi:serine/threonine protein kinase/Tfp pilus assembly protein PilF
VCLFKTALGSADEENDQRQEPSRMQMEFGDYELLEEIGRGGQGVVYRARQKSLNRTVALKVIGLGQWSSTPHLKRFRHEAEAAASLEHPQIVPIYEIGERDGSCYFSMKFVEGGQLDEVVSRNPISIQRAAELLVKIARTVQFAHEHGILHRDIKPGNILLDRGGEPHLTDFGLARLLEQESTITNSFDVLGTPSYMSPEQAAGHIKELTPAADVYSLGAVFYQMLTGEPPFAGGTTYDTIRMVLESEPGNPRARNPKIDVDLATICLKCLEKNPQNRYETAAALADDVERWLRHEPIKARRAGVFIRGKKWLQRNPSTAISAVSLAAFVAALGVIIWKSDWLRSPPTGIAVLPFENLSDNKENAFFADGIQDEILTKLAAIAGLKVISRNSVMSYRGMHNSRQIGRALNVSHLLEGSVQRAGNRVHLNAQLVDARTDRHVWAQSYERDLADVFAIQSEIAKTIAQQLQARLTGGEERTIEAKPTENLQAYDAYLRGLAYAQKTARSSANDIAAQKYLREAVQLDPKFAQAWALLSYVDARGYVSLSLQPTLILREEARQAVDTALNLQPTLGEALHAKGYYHYACLKDYNTAERYLERAREALPNSSRIPESLAYLARRRGQWDRSESAFNEAERLDPRSVGLLTQHALSYLAQRRFPEADRKLDEVLDIGPDDPYPAAVKASIAHAQGDLPRAAALLASLRPNLDQTQILEIQAYHAVLERSPSEIIARLKELLTKPDPTLGYNIGCLRFYLGWVQDVTGDHAGALASWQQARNELEPLLKEQPENYLLIGALAFSELGLGDKAAALRLAEAAMAADPIAKDALVGPRPLEIFARVAAGADETDRAIDVIQKLLGISYAGVIERQLPLTPALLQLDSMFDPLRSDPRFEEILEQATQPIAVK